MAKILIIDDDGIVRDALFVFLTRAGHEVFTAADGANGVQVFKSALPELVVLDRDLPILSGSGVFDKIREVSKTVPILILSGYNDPEEVGAYLRSGAAAFLPKSDGLSPVLAEIDRLLGVPGKAADAVTQAPEPAPPPAAKAAASPAGKTAPVPPEGTILIADDDEEIRRILRRFLSSLSYEVIEAKDGAEALALARMRRPDVILLDISMPKKDGIEVLKELAPEMPGAGFMMITGNEDEELARQCLALGAFDYVPKPINMESLGRIIKARLMIQE
ncbi:MAG: response regulator [Elusimicrobiota bacterium]|nr:response regulator [Elusimicrobiota bacterium]